MKHLWEMMRAALCAIGFFLIYGGVGTSDYYSIELGQSEPSSVWLTIGIGIVLTLPALFHLIFSKSRGGSR